MRSIIALAVLLGCGRATLATPPDVRVWESRDSSHITEGETILDVDPDTAYAAAIDYPRWSSMFPDIVQVDVTKQQGVDARVTLVHRAGNRDNVHFHNQPQARMVWFEDTGGRAEVWVEIVFAPGDRFGTTRVHSRLFCRRSRHRVARHDEWQASAAAALAAAKNESRATFLIYTRISRRSTSRLADSAHGASRWLVSNHTNRN